jgi:hypothetical protein
LAKILLGAVPVNAVEGHTNVVARVPARDSESIPVRGSHRIVAARERRRVCGRLVEGQRKVYCGKLRDGGYMKRQQKHGDECSKVGASRKACQELHRCEPYLLLGIVVKAFLTRAPRTLLPERPCPSELAFRGTTQDFVTVPPARVRAGDLPATRLVKRGHLRPARLSPSRAHLLLRVNSCKE